MGSRVQKAIDEASELWMRHGVSVVGQGEKDGKDCIIILAEFPEELSGIIPETFKGFPVVIKKSPPIFIQETVEN